eukprot:11513952-Alexandrium_andersonii.AAC.1
MGEEGLQAALQVLSVEDKVESGAKPTKNKKGSGAKDKSRDQMQSWWATYQIKQQKEIEARSQEQVKAKAQSPETSRAVEAAPREPDPFQTADPGRPSGTFAAPP